MIWWIIYAVLLGLNVAWWKTTFRLTKKRWLRTFTAIFMAVQVMALLSVMVKSNWLGRAPKPMLVSIILWHYFILAVFLPLALAGGVAWLVQRKRRQNPAAVVPANADLKLSTRREFLGACAVAAPALFNFGLTGTGLAQLNDFRVRRFTLAIPSLPRALDGMTIAQVSDMHVGRLTCGRVLKKMVNTTNELRADLVLLTGDLIDYELADLPEALALVKAMESRHGLWMIEGNHDLFENAGRFEWGVKFAGVPLLLNESVIANVRGHPVQIFGMRWIKLGWMHGLAGGDLERDRLIARDMRLLMKDRQSDTFPILMAHHPHAFDQAVRADLPLTLSGHTHGGQWMLNHRYGVGSMLFRYWSGLYARGNSQLVVSNGVGNVFPIRINAPAEIVHLTLRCA